MDDQHTGRRPDMNDGREVLRNVVRELVKIGIDCPGTHHGDHDGVAVGGCPRDDLHSDDALRAAAVVDYDRLAKPLRELLGQQASLDVGGSTRRERHDEPYRLVGIDGFPGGSLRACFGGNARGGEHQQCLQQGLFHKYGERHIRSLGPSGRLGKSLSA